MIVLLDTSHNLDDCAREIGAEVQQLLTPLTRFSLQRPEAPFAIDNGCFAGFQDAAFCGLLKREWERREQCLFVTLPDVVGNARRTLECFEYWYGKTTGWKRALVAQDGLEYLPIPWDLIDAIFIGGSTAWKLSAHAADIIRTGQILGKWTHAGRVNTPGRFEYFQALGVDSIDGTGLSRYSWMRQRIYEAVKSPRLFNEVAV